MKKNKMMRLASVLLVLCLLTTSVISGTFAKYVTTDQKADTARVAKFGVVASLSGDLFGATYNKVAAGNSITSYSQNGKNGETVSSADEAWVVAPGTENKEGLTLSVTGTPEVSTKVYAQRYDRMIAKREEQIANAKKRIEELENIGQIIRSRQAKLRKDIGLIDDILADGKISEAHLRMLIERIYVYETEGGLSLEIKVKAPFQNHTDSYENGVLTNSEIEELIGVS